jgi:hypothetical protein
VIKLVIGYSLHDQLLGELIIPRVEITFAAVLSVVSKSRPARFIDQPAQPFHCA